MKKNLLFLVMLLLAASIHANDKLVVSQWMTTPAHQVPMPVFHQVENTAGKVFDATKLLEFDRVNLKDHFPEEGKTLTVVAEQELTWTPVVSDSNGFIIIDHDTLSQNPQVTYLATYIWADRFVEISLELKSPYLIKAWFDGHEIGTKKSTEEEENTIGKVSKDLKLERGKHLLIIKTIKPANTSPQWKVVANLEIKEPFSLTDLNISLSPLNRKNIHHVMDGLKATSVNLSADGSFYTITYRRALPPSDKSESWTELRRTADNQLVQSFRHTEVSQMQWLPNSNKISYVHTNNKKTTLYSQDIENGQLNVLFEDLENFASYKWAPNEQYIIYSIREEGSGTDDDMRQILGMQDRQSHFRNRSFLYRFDISTDLHTRLTYGNLSTSLHDISPDSQYIIFAQNFPDYTSPSFSRQNVFRLRLETLQLDTLWMNEARSASISFSPDGNQLLATAGPSAFDGAGENVPQGTIPNNYDTQAYIYNLGEKSVNAFTKYFDPSVGSAYWNKADNNIYLVTTDEDYKRIYRYDTKKEKMSLLELSFDYVSALDFAQNAPLAVFKASQTNNYPRFYSLNLKNMKQTLLDDVEKKIYQHVELGEVKDWDFTASTGVEITGRVYYPPGFDSEVKYPVIVYYYGGTTPVGRTFAGRYPFNLWAGSGYLVYVLQPSGATGFGQEFSAAHVNNWGITVADEIIEGTKAFFQAHPFADASKVGCAGASYGGFMTMLLMTRTDMFTTAISHAGISSIASYWGEGYWGYSYSAEASAGSFPWNSKDMYINQSPLFHADKINTPLLLLTGDSDTNVPPGESIQLYTALKILDRPVELVMVKGEDHHIITYGKRIKWHNTIMAWWDKYLKDQPQWWDELYPEKNY